ncbi:Ankyrin repeat domain containing protein [Pandoravirus salinus]|uniref:Ankyrin repeat domain containing protein n=1 Tax=Pandoravirus salinus TaxID=1349410 RepID=S4VXM1_9VIRU|nr:ankyrin repeat domain [Pandoravirus salinus]AGO84206.1 Ankyrin repeat domain containing protein [Pandoravirus salinus]
MMMMTKKRSARAALGNGGAPKKARPDSMVACISRPSDCRGHRDDHDATTISIDDLPDEILVFLFDHLPCLTRCGNVAAVCRRWRAVALDSTTGARTLCASRTTINPCLSAASALHVDCVDEALRLAWSWHGAECEHAARAGRIDLVDRFRACGCPFDAHSVAVAAAGAGRLNVLRHLHQQNLLEPRGTDLISAAAAGGHIVCVEFAQSVGFRWYAGACTMAAGNGHLACLRYLHEHGCPWDERTTEAAAGYDPEQNPYSASEGHIDCLRYLHEHGCPWDEGTCGIAAQRGAVACLVYALDHGCPRDESSLGVAAVYSGEVAILDVLQARRHRWDACATAVAAEHGRWDLVEILRAYGCPWDVRVCTGLTSMGRLDLLLRARADGCPWEPEACMAEAIRHGRIDIVRWLCQHTFGNGNDRVLRGDYCEAAVYRGHCDALACLVEHECPWDPTTIARTLGACFDMDCLDYVVSHGMVTGAPVYSVIRLCTRAARDGRVDILRLLYASGYRGDATTTAAAAESGHLACLQWLVQQECPVDASAIDSATGRGHLGCVAYLCEHGIPWPRESYGLAVAQGHHTCLAYMDAHGCLRCDDATEIAAGRGHLDVLRYLHESGCAWSADTCLWAARYGHLACLRYAHAHGAPIDIDQCKTRAAGNGHGPCVRYLARCARP